MSAAACNTYPIENFCIYLMPKQPAPVYAPCQSDVLPSVFEDDDDDDIIEVDFTVLQKAKNVMAKLFTRGDPAKSSSPKSFSPARLLTKTLPSKFSRFRTNSLNSSSSE
ncbi:hypothetical protein PGT21_016973 [Puccinia graminis f. sp. tritici]|uniref:Uncharacterized protein n=1 Tax=Puccinia graminis f. sp. tritici TaxID=56615 RepID=A0A5B0M5T5_PUCGR|nr:hypothetical protein PGT21_016973 [Puccinia graminis f. sp. tritici]